MQSFAGICKRAMIVTLCLLLLLMALPFAAAADDEDAMEKDSLFVSVRHYEGVDPESVPEIMSRTTEGYLPIIRESEGFVGYFLMNSGIKIAAVALFESAEEASASTEAARDFVAENFADLMPEAIQVVEGTVDVFYIATLADMDEDMDDDAEHADDSDDAADEMAQDEVMSLWAALRIYENVDLSNLEEDVQRIQELFLPIQQAAEGFWGYMVMTDGEGVLSAFSIYDSEENATAVNVEAAAFVAEYLADMLPDDPVVVTGQLGIAALAGVEDGANLIGMMSDDDMDGEDGG